eukprot:SM000315S11889  [mRNA]  locus=s315:99909:101592:+ [translate_table: standard]
MAQFLPHIVQSLSHRDQLQCLLTGKELRKDERAVWQHMMGRRFQQALAKKEAQAKREQDEAGLTEAERDAMAARAKRARAERRREARQQRVLAREMELVALEREVEAAEVAAATRGRGPRHGPCVGSPVVASATSAGSVPLVAAVSLPALQAEPMAKQHDSGTSFSSENDDDSGADMWEPPVGDRWDGDSGGLRWGDHNGGSHEGDDGDEDGREASGNVDDSNNSTDSSGSSSQDEGRRASGCGGGMAVSGTRAAGADSPGGVCAGTGLSSGHHNRGRPVRPHQQKRAADGSAGPRLVAPRRKKRAR